MTRGIKSKEKLTNGNSQPAGPYRTEERSRKIIDVLFPIQ